MPVDIQSLLAALRSIPNQGMSVPDRLNDIANTTHHLNNMDLSPQTRQYFANKVIGHYNAMNANLPQVLQNYDPTKSLNDQIAPPLDPSQPVKLGGTNNTVPPRPWQQPWPQAQPPKQLKRVLTPNIDAAIGGAMLPNSTGGGYIKRPFETDTE